MYIQRLTIQLKTPEEEQLRDQLLIKCIKEKTTIREKVIALIREELKD
jgi:hypothetical protein